PGPRRRPWTSAGRLPPGPRAALSGAPLVRGHRPAAAAQRQRGPEAVVAGRRTPATGDGDAAMSDPSTAYPDEPPHGPPPGATPPEGTAPLAAAWDEVLTDGAPEGPAAPTELRSRIEKGLACARLLRRHWGEPPGTAEYRPDSPGGAPAPVGPAGEHPVH